jgi:hypothetical protein
MQYHSAVSWRTSSGQVQRIILADSANGYRWLDIRDSKPTVWWRYMNGLAEIENLRASENQRFICGNTLDHLYRKRRNMDIASKSAAMVTFEL